MKKVFLIAFILILTINYLDNLQPDKHISPAVTLIGNSGDCYGGPGSIEGFASCKVTILWPDGRTEDIWAISDSYDIDTILYRECWIDNERSECFDTFTDKPRDEYLNGSGKYFKHNS